MVKGKLTTPPKHIVRGRTPDVVGHVDELVLRRPTNDVVVKEVFVSLIVIAACARSPCRSAGVDDRGHKNFHLCVVHKTKEERKLVDAVNDIERTPGSARPPIRCG